MTVRTIRQLGDPVLRQVSQAISEFGTPELLALVADLRDTLHAFQAEHKTGRGIAAPQIGINQRVIYMECQGKAYTLLNPQFMDKSERMFTLWDSCFSYFGISFEVKRHYAVRVAYHDESGQRQIVAAEDELAELLQHEMEHLDGVLAIDQLIPVGRVMEQTEFLRRARS